MSDHVNDSAAPATEEWIVRYTWPASDADPYNGPQKVHEDPAYNEDDARRAAQTWRDSQAALGLKVDAEAVKLPASGE